MPRPSAEQIFHAAREKPGGPEREAYLEGACAGDANLRARVDALLRADASAGSFMGSVGPGREAATTGIA